MSCDVSCDVAGVKGILVAQDLNVCDSSNATAECVPELSLSASIVLDNSTQPGVQVSGM